MLHIEGEETMKFWLSLLFGIVALFVLLWLLSTAVGLLFWGALIVLVVAVVAALVRSWLAERERLKVPGKREVQRTEKAAERALKDLEKKVEIEQKS